MHGTPGRHHTNFYRYARMPINNRTATGIITGQSSPKIEIKFIIPGWPYSKDEISDELKLYWSYRDELAVSDGIVLKGMCIIIPNSLRQQVLDQLHINHMGIEKTKLLGHECVYWHSINPDIETYIKQCITCLEFQEMQPKEKNHSS